MMSVTHNAKIKNVTTMEVTAYAAKAASTTDFRIQFARLNAIIKNVIGTTTYVETVQAAVILV